MKNLIKLIALVGFSLPFAFAQPAVFSGGIRNAASNALDGLPNAGIAPGSYFTIYGTKLGPATGVLYSGSLPFQTNLAGSSVKVTVGGVSADAAIIYVRADQINAILPSNVPVGSGSLTVTYNGQTSAAATIHVIASAFGIYTLNSGGSGPGIFSNFNSATDQPVNTINTAGHPGQYEILWGNGLGAVSPVNEFGAPQPGDLHLPVQVWVGGQPATVTYAGRSGCCIAEDQVVFILPNNVPLGCHVPVAVQIGSIVSNFATIAVAQTGNVCSDSAALTSDQIAKAQANGSYTEGLLTLNQIGANISIGGLGSIPLVSDQGTASFGRYSVATLLNSAGPTGYVSTIGVCSVFTNAGTGIKFPNDPTKPAYVDAGSVINVSGPNGAKQLTKGSDSTYSAQLGGVDLNNIFGASSPAYLKPGSYTIDNGTGGSGVNAVGPFKVTVALGQPATWTNQSSISNVDRTKSLQLTWTGGDPTGYVAVLGIAPNEANSAGFYCTAKSGDGQLTVPSYVLMSLPVDNAAFLGLLTEFGNTSFTATGIDSGSVVVTSTNVKTVAYQ